MGEIQGGLVDQIYQTRHMGRLPVFPMRTVTFNVQSPSFISTYLMTVFTAKLDQILFFCQDPL